jgi:uncharacterized protein
MEVKMIRRIVWGLAAVALVAAVGLGAAWVYGQAMSPVAAQSASAPAYSAAETITVVGQGSVQVAPNIAQIMIGVETMAETVSEAVAENAAKMEGLLAALKAEGVAEKDIQTTNFSINFERYAEPTPRVLEEGAAAEPRLQYRVSNMVNVTVRDLDTVSGVLDAVIEAGANNIWGVNFSLDERDEAQAEARSQAVADARARAEALAALSEVTLGPVMAVSEVVGSSPYPVTMVAAERAAVAGAGPISPGEVEISYQVQVTYFIER